MVGIDGFAGSVRVRALGGEAGEPVTSAESSWDAVFFLPSSSSLSLTSFFSPVCQS